MTTTFDMQILRVRSDGGIAMRSGSTTAHMIRYVTAKADSDEEVCGICGQRLGGHEDGTGHLGASGAGKDAEYVVAEIRGLAICQPVSEGAKLYKASVRVLVQNLQLNADDLVGRHFICHEVRDAYGTTRTRHRLVDGGDVVPDSAHGPEDPAPTSWDGDEAA